MRYIVNRDARVNIRGSLQFLPRGWIVTNERPPRKPSWQGVFVQSGTLHIDDQALDDLVSSGAPLTLVDGQTPMEQCPHCGKSFNSNFAPPPAPEEAPPSTAKK